MTDGGKALFRHDSVRLSHCFDRLPPPFAEIPTDAEYAMHLISSRVAAGQDVLPSGSKRHRPHSGPVEIGQPIKTFSGKSGMNSIGKFIVNEAQRIGAKIPVSSLACSSPYRLLSSYPGRYRKTSSPFASAVSRCSCVRFPDCYVRNLLSVFFLPRCGNYNAHTMRAAYMGQLGSSPGLITLTSKRLYFTSPFSESIKREIDLDKISGVRKSGVLKGLQISYHDGTEHCELKFSWINSRDELFTRLVGLGNRRWRSV